jgi:hypothetical protein
MTGTARLALSLLLLLAVRTSQAQGPRGDRCALFKTAEIQKLLGRPVEDGESGSGGTLCQWFGKDQKSWVIVSVLDSSFFVDPRNASGYQVVPGVGRRAYTHMEDQGGGDTGWIGEAQTDKATVRITVIGRTATREAAAALLKETVARF